MADEWGTELTRVRLYPLQERLEMFIEGTNPGDRCFIDCGGNDGCSVIKYLLLHPGWRCLTVEPNRIFGPYYRLLPTVLIEAGVSDRYGSIA